MEEDSTPTSGYKIPRCPYDIESDRSDDDEDTAVSSMPCLLEQLHLLTVDEKNEIQRKKNLSDVAL